MPPMIHRAKRNRSLRGDYRWIEKVQNRARCTGEEEKVPKKIVLRATRYLKGSSDRTFSSRRKGGLILGNTLGRDSQQLFLALKKEH